MRSLEQEIDEIFDQLEAEEELDSAMARLKAVVYDSCAPGTSSSHSMVHFLKLQDSFEYNIATRLQALLSRSTNTFKSNPDNSTLATLIEQCLLLLQGLALMHLPSKTFLGRKQTLTLLIYLLAPGNNPTSPLPSVALDSLLCILVDSPPLLRTFEAIGGVEVVVKILKRGGTQREVKMKCLEFLYFYLRDESAQKDLQVQTVLDASRLGKEKSIPKLPAIPKTPEKTKRPFPSSVQKTGPNGLFRMEPGSPTKASFCSPSKTGANSLRRIEPGSPTKASFGSPSKRLQGYGLLRGEIDFVPTTPKKAKGSVAQREPPPKLPSTRLFGDLLSKDGSFPGGQENRGEVRVTRSLGEKKEFLGHLVGNVDALVEGVGEAGIFGLS